MSSLNNNNKTIKSTRFDLSNSRHNQINKNKNNNKNSYSLDSTLYSIPSSSESTSTSDSNYTITSPYSISDSNSDISNSDNNTANSNNLSTSNLKNMVNNTINNITNERNYISNNNNNNRLSPNSNNNNKNNTFAPRQSTELEYSADIRPLSFKMNKHNTTTTSSSSRRRSPSLDTIQDNDNNLYSIDIIKEKLNKIRDPNHINNNNTNNTTNNTNNNNDWNYSFFDKDQFTKYLEKPKYIKIYHSKNKIGAFDKLFLAQELNTNLLPQSTNLSPLDKINSRRLNGGRLSISSSDSNSYNNNYTVNNTTKINSNNGNGTNSKTIMSLKFSKNGKYMSAGNKDGSIRIWKVISSPTERWELNNNIDEDQDLLLKNKLLNQANHNISTTTTSNTSSKTSFESSISNESNESIGLYAPVVNPTPIKFFKEHNQDILDMDWSKNDFLISASMDKTVKLWHIEKFQSLKTFQHLDFVTSVRFHPTDDRFFISGCLDHNIRLWSIVDNNVCYRYDCRDLITSLTISDDGHFTIVGTFNGFIHILNTKNLIPITAFHLTDKATQGEHSKPYEQLNLHNKVFKGPRITGIQIINNNNNNDKEIVKSKTNGSNINKQIIITSNDSRIRVFDVKTKKLIEFLKGFNSGSSQHLAQYVKFHNRGFVVCSSDDHWVYGWSLHSHDKTNDNENQKKKKKNNNTTNNNKILPFKLSKIFPTHHGNSDHSAKKNSRYLSFHAHHYPVTTTVIAPESTSKVLSLSNDFICELTLQYLRDSKNSNDNNNTTQSDKKKSNKKKSKSNKSLLDDKLIKSSFEHNLPDPASIIGPIIVTSDSQGIIRIFRFDMRQDVRKGILNLLKRQDALTNNNNNNNNNNTMDQSIISSNNTLTNSFSNGNNNHNNNNTPTPPPNFGRAKSKSLTNIPLHDNINNNSNNSILLTNNNNNNNNSVNDNKEHNDNNNNISSNDSFCPKKGSFSSMFGKLNGSDTDSKNGGGDGDMSNHHQMKSPRLSRNSGSFPRIMEEQDRRNNKKNLIDSKDNSNSNSSSRNNTINSLSALNLRCSTCNGTNFEPLGKNSLGQRDLGYCCVDCGTILNNFR